MCTPTLWAVLKMHVFGVMVGGDEFCFRLGEHVGRAIVDIVLADSFTQRPRRHEQKSWRHHWKLRP